MCVKKYNEEVTLSTLKWLFDSLILYYIYNLLKYASAHSIKLRTDSMSEFVKTGL